MKLHSYLMTAAFRAGDGPACYAILQEHFGVKLPETTGRSINRYVDSQFFTWDDVFIYQWRSDRGFYTSPTNEEFARSLTKIYGGSRYVMAHQS